MCARTCACACIDVCLCDTQLVNNVLYVFHMHAYEHGREIGEGGTAVTGVTGVYERTNAHARTNAHGLSATYGTIP